MDKNSGKYQQKKYQWLAEHSQTVGTNLAQKTGKLFIYKTYYQTKKKHIPKTDNLNEIHTKKQEYQLQASSTIYILIMSDNEVKITKADLTPKWCAAIIIGIILKCLQ